MPELQADIAPFGNCLSARPVSLHLDTLNARTVVEEKQTSAAPEVSVWRPRSRQGLGNPSNQAVDDVLTISRVCGGGHGHLERLDERLEFAPRH